MKATFQHIIKTLLNYQITQKESRAPEMTYKVKLGDLYSRYFKSYYSTVNKYYVKSVDRQFDLKFDL